MKSLVCIGLLLALAATGLSTTWYVAPPPDGSDSHDGTSDWSQAFATISNAIAKSTHGHTILVTNGDYVLGAELLINKTIDIQSVNGPEVTSIDGNNSVRCVYFNNALAGASTNSKIQGFTIKNGNGSVGSGISVSGQGATVHNCILVSNAVSAYALDIRSTSGGFLCTDTRIERNVREPIYMRYGDNYVFRDCTIASNNGSIRVYDLPDATNRVFDRCVITHNSVAGLNLSGATRFTNCLIAWNTTSTRGGGVYATAGASLLWGCTIASNQSGTEGGGVYASAPLTLNQCRVVGNTGGSGAGGFHISSSASNVVLSNCWILDNYGAQGGGISDSQSTLLANCLIAGNSSGTNATDRGGGIYFFATTKTSQYWNCTIVSNVAVGGLGIGGGLWYNGGGVHMVNCILYDNSAATAGSNWSYSSGSLFITNTCTAPTNGAGIEGANNTSEPPGWVNPAAGDFRLGAGSPCINAGLTLDWMAGARDLDGRPRLDRFSRQVDMGVYEAVPAGTLFQVR